MFNLFTRRTHDETTHELLRAILAELQRRNRPQRPFHVIVTQLFEWHAMSTNDLLTFKAQLTPLTAPHDVVTRHLKVLVGGSERLHLTTPADVNDFEPFATGQGSDVTLQFQDEDDAGNFSPVLEYSFTAIDQIPPEQPGGVSVTPVSEEPGSEYVG